MTCFGEWGVVGGGCATFEEMEVRRGVCLLRWYVLSAEGPQVGQASKGRKGLKERPTSQINLKCCPPISYPKGDSCSNLRCR